ncbi:hypothetical protein [Paracoccus aminophilus]|uniref:Uncharacterized protein n=1 Tax=Paracoccus aminophilus JCM 7686 TaxID=1367847 RepID=S5XNU7_PARAH|nr:hypothetical protein [Paracoccus aminophilus]AGT08999.1 hypothetical protein JCM7686_1898 [Paracoccus aminophilus JCM 7686]
MRALIAAAFFAAAFPLVAQADTVFEIKGGQVSVPEGVLLRVKKVTVGTDATVLNVTLSYDGDSGSVQMTDDPTFLELPDGQRLMLRAIADNPNLAIAEGETLEGDLVFPGVIPEGTDSVKLVMNEGRKGDDIAAPGLTLTLDLKAAQ